MKLPGCVCWVSENGPVLNEERPEFPGLSPFEKESGIFLCIGDRNPIQPQPLGSCEPIQE